MNLKEIRVKGFRSFADEQVLAVGKLPAGLYLLTGSNEVDEQLEGNGVGKSSLFDSVFWTLHGKTSRSLKAGTIKNWGSKSVQCALVCREGTIERGWGPNYLRVDGDEVDQEFLEKLLKLTPEVSLNTFYFAQFSPCFVDLSAPARMDIYSTVLGLDLWDERSERAKRYAAAAREQVHQLELRAAKAKEHLATLKGVDYAEAAQQWEEKRAAQLAEVDTRLAALKDQLVTADLEHKSLTKAIASAERDAKKETKVAERSMAILEDAKDRHGKATHDERVANTLANQAKRSLDEFKAGKPGKCSKCGLTVTLGHRKSHLDELSQAWKEAEAAAREARETSDRTLELYTEAKEAHSNIDSSASEGAKQLTEAREKIVAHITVLLDKGEELEKRKDSIEKEVNLLAVAQRRNKASIKQAKTELKLAEGELEDARKEQKHLEFWVRGFKEVRFQVIQESLVQLNTEVNESLHQLGLEDWRLEFNVEKETKSGTVKRGFLVSVHNERAGVDMPWEAWSGGETQRLRLAAQLGVANMLCARSGHSFNFELWDEPSNWLSPNGIKELLNVLQERAQRYGKRILIADHRAFDFDFDGVINLTKTEAGSEISTARLP